MIIRFLNSPKKQLAVFQKHFKFSFVGEVWSSSRRFFIKSCNMQWELKTDNPTHQLLPKAIAHICNFRHQQATTNATLFRHQHPILEDNRAQCRRFQVEKFGFRSVNSHKDSQVPTRVCDEASKISFHGWNHVNPKKFHENNCLKILTTWCNCLFITSHFHVHFVTPQSDAVTPRSLFVNLVTARSNHSETWRQKFQGNDVTHSRWRRHQDVIFTRMTSNG